MIEITDNESNEVFRYVNCNENIEYENNIFTASSFTIQPPEKTNDKIGDGKLTFSSIDGEWIGKIRNASKRFSLRFIAVMDYTESNNRIFEKLDDINFTLTNTDWNDTTISVTMKFDEAMDIVMPVDKLTELICPALG